MKEAHPDKFQGDEDGLKAAEENSFGKYQSWNY
jgi:hypothetical protein